MPNMKKIQRRHSLYRWRQRADSLTNLSEVTVDKSAICTENWSGVQHFFGAWPLTVTNKTAMAATNIVVVPAMFSKQYIKLCR